MAEKKKGRPRIIFGEDEMATVEEMAALFSTKGDIADILLMDVPTLERKVKEFSGKTLEQIMKKAEAMRKLTLKKSMFELSKRNGTVAVYLAKTHLEEPEDLEEEFEGIQVEVVDGSKEQAEKKAQEEASQEVKTNEDKPQGL
jgi:ribosome biogenesis GTPase A